MLINELKKFIDENTTFEFFWEGHCTSDQGFRLYFKDKNIFERRICDFPIRKGLNKKILIDYIICCYLNKFPFAFDIIQEVKRSIQHEYEELPQYIWVGGDIHA